jgi:hypothetical protein
MELPLLLWWQQYHFSNLSQSISSVVQFVNGKEYQYKSLLLLGRVNNYSVFEQQLLKKTNSLMDNSIFSILLNFLVDTE